MNQIGFAFALVISAFFLLGCAAQPSAPPAAPSTQPASARLQIYTEDFPPYNYLDASGKVTGKSTLVVRELLSRLNQSAGITLGPLSDGYSHLLTGPNVAMYSLGRTPERESKFKWVGPIGEWELTLYAAASSPLASSFKNAADGAAKMELARKASGICVVKDDVRHQYLLAQNFTNTDAVITDDICAQKLASGADALWFGSSTSFEKIVSGAGLSASAFAPVYTVQTNQLYIAFSKDVPDSTVAKWQSTLDAMKQDGTFAAISAPAAPQINLEPMQAVYAPGEVTRRCDEAIANANASLNEIGSRPAGQRSTALLDFEKTMADYYDAADPLSFTGYVYPDANISAEGAACEEKMGRFGSEVMTRKDIYNAVKEFTPKNAAQARLYNRTITAFDLNGLALPDDKLAAVREMKQNLSTMESKFSQNLNLDNKTIEFTAAELDGAPQDFLSRLAKAADGKYIVTMKYPDYNAVMQNVKSSETRRRMSLAFQNRGSPAENTRLLEDAILLREKLASALGFANWADYKTSMRMAKNASNVDAFIAGLEAPLANKSREDISGLLAFYKTLDPNASEVHPWDVAYLENQIMKTKYSLDTEKVREYFPQSTVMQGMAALYSHLFNVSIQPVQGAVLWHPDVLLYRVSDPATNATLSYIYFDLYPRENKYGHGAMWQIVSGREKDGSYVTPIIAIVANFNPPASGKPALMSHDDVVTLFHEFGHSMHATLSTVPYASLSGTSVAWDFVETPSQSFENWAWDPQVISSMSGHYLDASQKVPQSMIGSMIAARNLGQGISYAQRLAQSKMDMDFHTASGPVDVNAVSNAEIANLTGLAPVEGNSFPATFGHLMGGYDAGYYSYMWSEAYALDIFSQFQAEGTNNQTTGLRYRNEILSQGDLKDADVLLQDFLGRPANSDAFLKKLNITQGSK